MASPVEGRQALDAVLTAKGVADIVRGRALWAASTIAHARGDLSSGGPLSRRRAHCSHSLATIGYSPKHSGRLGWVAISDGQFDRARELVLESERIAAETGDPKLLAVAADARAHIALYQGDYAQAEVLFEQGLQHTREAEDPGTVKYALTNLGFTVLEQGRLRDAASLFRASLAIHVDLTRSSADVAIEGLAAIAVARGDAATAARLLGATGEWRRKVGYIQEPFESAILDRTAAATRKALGDHLYRDLAQEGAALDLDEAAKLALATID